MGHKQVIVMRKDLNMRKGKMVAQGAHASLGAILGQCTAKGDSIELLLDDRLKPWITGKFTKICLGIDNEADLVALYQKAKDEGLIVSLIEDAGLTEFNGVPTITCCAIGPDADSKIDAITGHLKLL